MSTSENVPGGAPLKPTEEKAEADPTQRLHAEVRSLRILLNVTLISMLVLVASLFCFMYQERKLVRQKLEENSRYLAEYKRKVEPRLAEFGSKLFAYSKLHTNFTPIFVKYFGATNAAVAPGATSSIPALPESSPEAPP